MEWCRNVHPKCPWHLVSSRNWPQTAGRCVLPLTSMFSKSPKVLWAIRVRSPKHPEGGMVTLKKGNITLLTWRGGALSICARNFSLSCPPLCPRLCSSVPHNLPSESWSWLYPRTDCFLLHTPCNLWSSPAKRAHFKFQQYVLYWN